ncbi:MAG TPA: hypothetical protein VHX15_21270, partial [Frankiaceae bacterium]|nr:hypothetical protein [Frankiaceae bacterium]
MAYHQTFWAVSGTAGPVFALTNAVAIGDSLEAIISARRAKPGARPSRQQLRSDGWRAAIRRLGHPLLRSYAAATGAFLINAVVTILALIALMQGTNIVPPITSILLLA